MQAIMRFCVLSFLCTALLHTSAEASKRLPTPATDVRPSWTLTVDPLTTILGFVHVQLERSIGDYVSVYVGPHVRFFDSLLGNVQGNFYGLGVELCVRVFFLGGAPFRWWVGVRGVFASLWTNEGREKVTYGGYVSLLAGYSWLFFGWLTLSLGAGVQYLDYQIEGKDPAAPMGVKGFLPALHTNLGVAF